MCTVLLPPGVNPIAFNKYIVSLNELLRQNNLHVIVQTYFNNQLNSQIILFYKNMYVTL